MPLSRVQTVVRGKAQDYTSPTLQSAPCRDYLTESSKMSETKMVFEVGMTCEGCENAARKVLGKLGDKVSKVDINLKNKTVTVTTTLPKEEILEQLKKTGKEVEFLSEAPSQQAVKEKKFHMEMTCEGCANAAKKALAKLGDNVADVKINLETQTVTMTTAMKEEEILEVLKKTGKTVKFLSEKQSTDEESSQRVNKR